MKYSIASMFILVLVTSGYGQQSLPKEHIQVAVSQSKHGSGDLSGIYFSTDYSKYIFKKLVIGGSIAGTIHDGETVYGPYLFIDGPANTPITKSIRYTTAGYQVAAFAGISMIRTKSHELQVRVGALARFQSAQNYNGGGIQAITTIVLPETRYVLLSNDGGHQRSYTLGYLAQLIYNYTFNEKYSIGLQAGMQNDQQGDIITHYGLVIGRRF